MTDEGSVIRVGRHYEDLASLKKYIVSRPSYYKASEMQEWITNFNVTTTGATPDMVEADDGIAVSQIGKTEVTLELTAAADEATHNTVVFSLTWIDNNGNEYTSEATGTAGLATTPVAFATPDATSVYAVTAFSASADFDNQDVYAKVNGGATFATITAAGAVTAATEAQMHGVGSLYGRSHTNHNDADNAVLQLEYLSGQGTIKYGHCTIPAADGTVETRFFEGTYSATTDTVTATTTTVKDFYRVRRLWSTTTPTANCHEFYICDADAANDGSGGDLYGLILEGAYESVHTTYTPPYGYDAWVGAWCVQAAQSAAADSYTFEIIYKLDGGSIYHTNVYEFIECIKHSNPVLLEEEEDVEFYVSDLATADVISGNIIIVEVPRV